MPATATTRARLRAPSWLVAAIAAAAVATGATLLIDNSGTSGSAARGNSILSQPTTCVAQTPNGPFHC